MKIKKNKSWYKMKLEGSEANIRIYDEIGGWGVSAARFSDELDDIGPVSKINLRLNSPGGEVFEGFAIYNLLKQHDAEVTVRIDGVAASIASIIAMAGDNIVMPENTFLMVHKPWMFAGGNADDFEKQIDLLNKIEDKAINVYASKATVSREEIAKLLADETWITAEEALSLGMATEVEGLVNEPEEDQKIQNHFMKVPEAAKCYFKAIELAPEHKPKQKKEPINEPEPKPAETPNAKGKGMNLKDILAKMKVVRGGLLKKYEGLLAQANMRLEADEANVLQDGFKAELEECLSAFDAVENLDIIDQKANEIYSKHETALLKAAIASTKPITPKVELGTTSNEKFNKAAKVAFMSQAGLKVDAKEYEDVRSEGLAGMGIQGYLRETLVQAGVPRAASMSASAIYDALVQHRGVLMTNAQGTGDFTSVLEDVANKSLANAWSTSPVTYNAWTGKDSIKDFRTKNIVRLTDMADVEKILENEGFKFGAMADSKETAKLLTVGVAWGISRQAIINDDLSALTDPGAKLARSVQRYINRAAYELLYGAAMVGPTMNEDGKAMFSSDHNNFVASGSGGAPTNSTLSVLRRKLMKQTQPTPDGGQSNPIYTRADPKVVLYHMDLDKAIEALIEPAYVMTTTADSAMTRQFIRRLLPVADPVLDELMDVNSHKGYYLLADPSVAGLINVYNLTGQDMPTIRRKNSDVGEPLGLSYDIYYDTGVAQVDFRGGAANYGK